MSKNCIISVAVRTPYVLYQQRLVDSCRQFGTDILYWTDRYPEGSRTHHESLYGFKIYAFLEAFKQGYENVLWLDSPAYLLSDPAPIFEQIENDGYYLISTETPLWKHVNNRTITEFGITPMDWKLLSGSFIGQSRYLFHIIDDWQHYEKRDFFLTAAQDATQTIDFDGFSGFKHDETILSLIAQRDKYKLTPHPVSHFQNDKAIVKSEKW